MSTQSLHQGARILRLAATLAVAVLLLLYAVKNCSGLPFSSAQPDADLRQALTDEYELTLPPSAVVDHANRQATIPAVHHYALHMAPADVAGFVRSIRLAAERRGKRAIDRNLADLPNFRPKPPSWWAVERLADPRWLDLNPQGRGGGMWVFYSERDGQVLLFRYSM